MYESIIELLYNLQIMQTKNILEYLKKYYKNDEFDTEIILWDQNFPEIKDLSFLNNLKGCVKGLFPDLRLKFINKKILNDLLQEGTSKVKLDYTISFDVNIASYILNPTTKNKCFREVFNEVKINNWDFNLYVFENYLKFGDSFFTNEHVYENIYKLFELIHPNESESFIKIEIDHFYQNIKNNRLLFEEFKKNHIKHQIFIMGLIYANFNFSKKEDKINYILKIFDNKIGQFMQREFMYAYMFFEKNEIVQDFFRKVMNKRVNQNKLLKEIENMAYDLLIIRNLEYFSSLKEVRTNLKVNGYIPFLFTGDKKLLKLIDLIKIKALIITKSHTVKKITPIYFEDIRNKISESLFEKFFTIEKIKNRQLKEINLEKNLEEMKAILLNSFSS